MASVQVISGADGTGRKKTTALRVNRRPCGSIGSAWHTGDNSGTSTRVATILTPGGKDTVVIADDTVGTECRSTAESVHYDDLRDASHASNAPFSLPLCLTTGRFFLQWSNAAWVLLK